MTCETQDSAADLESDRYAIPAYVKRQYLAQKHSSAQRGIVFDFTLLRWHLWWKAELAKIGPDAKRGRRRGEYVMARIGDQGAYEVGNVYCATAEQNIADQDRNRQRHSLLATWQRRKAAGERCWLEGKRGELHPKARAVVTPLGRFGSAALAAEAHGMTRQAASRKAREGRGGWGLA